MGYRYFDTKKVVPEFPFGFGMSYTSFALSNIKVKANGKDNYSVSVSVKNTGSAAGSEVVQLYVKDTKAKVLRPEKELKAFAKVNLNAGEEQSVTMKLNRSAFEYYDDVKNQWTKTKNGYQVLVGTSSGNIVLKADVK